MEYDSMSMPPEELSAGVWAGIEPEGLRCGVMLAIDGERWPLKGSEAITLAMNLMLNAGQAALLRDMVDVLARELDGERALEIMHLVMQRRDEILGGE